jgi:hypothetical protein
MTRAFETGSEATINGVLAAQEELVEAAKKINKAANGDSKLSTAEKESAKAAFTIEQKKYTLLK